MDININKSKKPKKKKGKKLGPFGDMGVAEEVVAGITRKGFKIPTAVQKKAIPVLLTNKDAVIMARTGSGKTAAFLIPILHKIQLNPSASGTRALILSPTRELAMQTLQFATELGKFTGIKAATVLGGEGWNAQFAAMLSKPDIIMATPGRFLHLCIEMSLNLDQIEYVVFDEADRLFNMGFDYQMREILNRLPAHRQTALISATLPKILVEFAKAGLTEPELIRLDTDGKISESLTQTFFKVNNDDKVALFLKLILEVIPTDQHTLIFVPTKYHCEYLSYILNHYDIPNSYVYSSQDTEFRKISVEKFRNRKVNHMIATDVAARGIDIPILDNVVNFNFPDNVKLYIHRVGRVARAGRTGTSYSFVAQNEIPHLIDIELFISKKIRFSPEQQHEDNSNSNEIHMLFGRVPQSMLNSNNGSIDNITAVSYDLQVLTKSMKNSFEKFKRTKENPSVASIKRQKNDLWGKDIAFHPLLISKEDVKMKLDKEKVLDAINIATSKNKKAITFKRKAVTYSEEVIAQSFGNTNKKPCTDERKRFFIPYKPDDYNTEGSYAVGTRFESETSKLTFNLNEDGEKEKPNNASKWDRRRKKYVNPQKEDMIKTESGQWIKKSYRTDKYFKWKASSEGRLFKKQAADQEFSKRPTKFTTVNKKPDRFSKQKVHPVMNGKQLKNVKDTVLNEDQVKKKIKDKKKKQDMMKQNIERKKQKRKMQQKVKPTYKKMKRGY